MVAIKVGALLVGTSTLAAAAPASLSERASCTFTDAATAIKNKASCSAIIIKDMTVPAGTTLDLTKLNDGTTVTFQGTTTFGYKEWEGPLISVSGTKITVNGASGHVIDGAGAKWWDGQGSNGGKTKPKVSSKYGTDHQNAGANTGSSFTPTLCSNPPSMVSTSRTHLSKHSASTL